MWAPWQAKRPVPTTPPSGLEQGGSGRASWGQWAAGFIATPQPGMVFTAASAKIQIPSPPDNITSPHAWVAIWIGIDIVPQSGAQLMQAGLSMYATTAGWNAIPWWINEPQSPPTEPHQFTIGLHPGNVVRVLVTETGKTSWEFALDDLSTGRVASTLCTGCMGVGSSAAWLVEDPSIGGTYAPFANPGPVRFLSAKVSSDKGPMKPIDDLPVREVVRRGMNRGSMQAPESERPGRTGAFIVA